MNVTVVGSGAGGMGVAADLSAAGHVVMLCDLPQFSENVAAVQDRGGIEVRELDGTPVDVRPIVESGTDIRSMTAGRDLVVVVAPLLAHKSLLPLVDPGVGQLLFVGEGGGALRVIGQGRDPSTVAETNTLPYMARVQGPGIVGLRPKPGGVYLAAAVPSKTAGWIEMLEPALPGIGPAVDVLDTLLANYNAIDHVPTVLANAGYLQAGEGPWRLWGEGCTPAVAAAIETLDAELQDVRSRLGLPQRRYQDCLVAQGFAPALGDDMYATIQSSILAGAEVMRGPEFLNSRFIREDVPHAMVLIESVVSAYGLAAPLVSAMITFTSALLEEDVRASGTTLGSLGLPETAADLDALIR